MKHVVITGTSRGMGFEMVKLFAEAGHQVIALSRKPASLQALNLNNVQVFACDLTKEEEIQKIGDHIKTTWKTVDVLINNAGAILNKSFAESSLDEFKAIYNTNVFGVAALIKELLPFMNSESHVVNISSMGGVQGSMKFSGLSAYSSSKGALITLTEMLAEEYKEKGPTFNVLALGAVQTEMLAEAFPGYKAPVSAQEMANYIVDFSLSGQKYYNGKLLQVSNSTP